MKQLGKRDNYKNKKKENVKELKEKMSNNIFIIKNQNKKEIVRIKNIIIIIIKGIRR